MATIWKSSLSIALESSELFFREVETEQESDVILKPVDEVVINGVYQFTDRSRPFSATRPDYIEERETMIRVTSIEDRGDFLYVGFKGLSANSGSFGASRLYKDGFKQWGLVDIKRAYQKKPY